MPTTDPTALRKELGDHLKTERVRQGLSQVEVGTRAGVPQTTVSEAERGLLGLDAYAKIAAALGLNLGLSRGDEGAA